MIDTGFARRDFIRLAAAGMATTTLSPNANAAPSEFEANVTAQPSAEPNSATNTADILVETLISWGAPFVFRILGDGINPLIEALRRRQDRIRHIGVRHEEAAAFMASGIAKHTGRLGVCLGTTGPGAIHLLNGRCAF
jgi:pyruvate dehydrogenase (quinone)